MWLLRLAIIIFFYGNIFSYEYFIKKPPIVFEYISNFSIASNSLTNIYVLKLDYYCSERALDIFNMQTNKFLASNEIENCRKTISTEISTLKNVCEDKYPISKFKPQETLTNHPILATRFIGPKIIRDTPSYAFKKVMHINKYSSETKEFFSTFKNEISNHLPLSDKTMEYLGLEKNNSIVELLYCKYEPSTDNFFFTFKKSKIDNNYLLLKSHNFLMYNNNQCNLNYKISNYIVLNTKTSKYCDLYDFNLNEKKLSGNYFSLNNRICNKLFLSPDQFVKECKSTLISPYKSQYKFITSGIQIYCKKRVRVDNSILDCPKHVFEVDLSYKIYLEVEHQIFDELVVEDSNLVHNYFDEINYIEKSKKRIKLKNNLIEIENVVYDFHNELSNSDFILILTSAAVLTTIVLLIIFYYFIKKNKNKDAKKDSLTANSIQSLKMSQLKPTNTKPCYVKQ